MTNRASQTLRRYSAVALCVLASLFLAACGGGSGAEGSRLDSTVPFSERPSSGGQSADTPEAPEQTVSDGQGAQTDTDSAADDATNDQVADSGSNNDDSTSSNDRLDPVEEVADELVAKVNGRVALEWYRPDYRENGDLIRDGEIDGYEVRYRKVGAEEHRSVLLEGETVVEHELEGLEKGEYEFSIAAYDDNGLYSEFVSISPLQ